MSEVRLHRLGQERKKVFESDFDRIYDLYKKKAEMSGYWGELKFIKERNNIIIYSIILFDY
jgi:hypothetical protein